MHYSLFTESRADQDSDRVLHQKKVITDLLSVIPESNAVSFLYRLRSDTLNRIQSASDAGEPAPSAAQQDAAYNRAIASQLLKDEHSEGYRRLHGRKKTTLIVFLGSVAMMMAYQIMTLTGNEDGGANNIISSTPGGPTLLIGLSVAGFIATLIMTHTQDRAYDKEHAAITHELGQAETESPEVVLSAIDSILADHFTPD